MFKEKCPFSSIWAYFCVAMTGVPGVRAGGLHLEQHIVGARHCG